MQWFYVGHTTNYGGDRRQSLLLATVLKIAFFGCPTGTKNLVIASHVLIYVTDSHVSKLGDLLTLC